MKYAITGAAVALLLGSVATPALAVGNGGTSSATANSTVRIIRPISVTNPANSTLQFGTLVAPSSGSGTVTIDPATGTPGYTNIDHAIGATGRADFKVDGEAGIAFSLTVPTSVTMAGPGSPGSDIVVTTTTNAPGGLTGTHTQTLGGVFPAAGTQMDVGVGGSITILSGQNSGDYTGQMTVTATYN